MTKLFSYTIIATYANVICAVLGLYQAFQGNISRSLVYLMVCGVLDGFDGRIAQLKKDRGLLEKSFGIQIDSSADLIAFALLPALIIYRVNPSLFIGPCIGIYILAALTRLAYFNVVEIDGLYRSSERRDYFEGLPVTTIAFFLPLIYSIPLRDELLVFVLSNLLVIIMALLFLVKVKIPKPRLKGLLVIIFLGLPVFSRFVSM